MKTPGQVNNRQDSLPVSHNFDWRLAAYRVFSMDETWYDGILYDRFMGRWSKLAAQKFLSWFAVPPGRVWVDVGCGTGSITRQILETFKPARIIAIDSSPGFISYAKRSITHPDVQFRVGLAQALDLESQSADAAVSGLVLNFVPQPEAAILEMLRVAKPGGRVGVFLWDYAGGMQMLRYFWDAAAELDPSASALDEGIRFPLCREGQLESLFLASGLKQVQGTAIKVATRFEDFDDYWQPYLGKVGAAPQYLMSLDSEKRRRLEGRLRKSLPVGKDGSILLAARAWAVRGTA